MGFFIWYDTSISQFTPSNPGNKYSKHFYDGPGYRFINPPINRDYMDLFFWPIKQIYMAISIKIDPGLENPNNPPW